MRSGYYYIFFLCFSVYQRTFGQKSAQRPKIDHYRHVGVNIDRMETPVVLFDVPHAEKEI